MESGSVVFYYSVVIHYSKCSKSVQTVVIHYMFSSESLRLVKSLQIVNSLRILFLACRGPLGIIKIRGIVHVVTVTVTVFRTPRVDHSLELQFPAFQH